MKIIRVKIDVSQMKKEYFFRSTKNPGRVYADITLLERHDEYGNDFMVVQDVGKEAREKGIKGPILGNAKYYEQGGGRDQSRNPMPDRSERNAPPARTPAKKDDGLDEDVPF
jgi:hypothetical protein